MGRMARLSKLGINEGKFVQNGTKVFFFFKRLFVAFEKKNSD